MLHPSYSDLMAVVNSEVEQGEQPVVQSRYSIVLATAKRARQIIAGQEPLVRTRTKGIKPLSIAVTELHDSKIKILTEEDFEAEQIREDELAVIAEAELARRAVLAAEKAAAEAKAKAEEEAKKAAAGEVSEDQDEDDETEDAEEEDTDTEEENE